MAAVLFGALSGVFFGALAVAVQHGLRLGADARVGALVVAGTAFLLSLPLALVEVSFQTVPMADLWPFALAGALVPGCSQIFFILAVRDAGPSRASILIGTAPLISIAIALALLHEPFEPLLLAGTALVVGGGAVLARERTRPKYFRALGVVFALLCAALFAVRDNVVRWAASDTHPPPLVSTSVALLAASLVVLLYLLVTRAGLRKWLRPALPAFVPAGISLGLAYVCLFEAFDRGRVSIVAPLYATQSLWAIVLSALLVGRAAEALGRRLVVAAALIVAGAAFIGAVR
jgi:drug/metabolite transporter (DMT)-like permease